MHSGFVIRHSFVILISSFGFNSMVLTKLAISNFLTHRVRVALSVSAIALSVGLVVAVTSGYASFEGAASFYMGKFLGSTDAMITREDHFPMDEAIATDIATDP